MPPSHVKTFWPSDAVSVASDVATLVGFASSVWLPLTLKSIKRRYQRVLLFTKYLPLLQRRCASLEILRAEYAASRNALPGEIGRIRGLLNSMTRDLGGDERQHIESVLDALNAHARDASFANLSVVYERMVTVEEQMSHSLDRAKLHDQ